MATHNNPISIEALEKVVIELIDLVNQHPAQITPEELRTLLLNTCFYIDGYHARSESTLAKLIATTAKAISLRDLHSPNPFPKKATELGT